MQRKRKDYSSSVTIYRRIAANIVAIIRVFADIRRFHARYLREDTISKFSRWEAFIGTLKYVLKNSKHKFRVFKRSYLLGVKKWPH